MHIKHASCVVLILNILLIFYHVAMLFVGALDPWKVLFIPLECLSSIVLFCGLVIEAKNSLLPFLFIQGFKIFVIGNNLYQGIEGMFDWGSEKMMEARCRRYFADLAHVLSADEQQEVEKGKDNEAIA
ncbi:unnamed protein product, partial [Mesorhabditis belari]|uniref:Uncharacterized protein n=1 Tax=Mesorhabditis belari TaxID=2138241 RepID=A0AAF3EDX2_9BILA